MPTPTGTIPTAVNHHAEISQAVTAVACFLIRMYEHERDGLTRRCAVLAAGSELGVDPADIVRRVREVAA